MVPVENGHFTGLHQSATHWPDALKQAAALCTSLTLVSNNQVAGDLADKQAFKAVEARFLVGSLTPVCFMLFFLWVGDMISRKEKKRLRR